MYHPAWAGRHLQGRSQGQGRLELEGPVKPESTAGGRCAGRFRSRPALGAAPRHRRSNKTPRAATPSPPPPPRAPSPPQPSSQPLEESSPARRRPSGETGARSERSGMAAMRTAAALAVAVLACLAAQRVAAHGARRGL